MYPAGLALSALLVLGLMCTASARSIYTEEAMADDAGAPSNYLPPMYPQYLRELVEVQQQQCMGDRVPVSVPYVNVDVCSVTPNQCGWVRVDVGGTFLGFSLGARVSVDVRVCDRNGNLCYRPIANDCSRISPLTRQEISVPVPNGNIAVDVLVQIFPTTDVCVQVHLPRCR